jgi:methionyl aminopeptidase
LTLSMNKLTKKPQEIRIINEGGQILHEILRTTAKLVQPGVSTAELNAFAENEMTKAGGRPSFIGYGTKKNPFPAGLCTSINDVVVHGIPSKKDILQEGDIVGLDIGMEYQGLYTDTAITVGVGKISSTAQRLIATAEKCLNEAIRTVRPGKHIGDIGYAIQTLAEREGFSVVRDLVGHGVGYAVHEDPSVPGYGRKGTGLELVSGMVLAIEPMLCQGRYQVYFDNDGWAIRTADGSLSAHFEHTIAVTDYGAKVLT